MYGNATKLDVDFRGLNIILLDYVYIALDHNSLVLDRVYTLTSAEVLAGYLPALTDGVRRAGVVIPWRDNVREGEGGTWKHFDTFIPIYEHNYPVFKF